MRPKTEVLAREIASLAIGVRVIPIQTWIESESARDVLKACDVVFGCTDDPAGRIFLNRFAYFYLRPVIDMGILMDKNPDGGFYNMSGRVTVLVPGSPCLLCRRIADPLLAAEESLRRIDPTEYERRRRERYIRGGGEPAPAVVTFTTETACMAVSELLQGLTDYRDAGGWAWQRTRRFDINEDRQPGAQPSENCPICSSQRYWGRGDIEPFLDRAA
jgi:molybdopterin/thiamine biosynthesis adenylyltransferase